MTNVLQRIGSVGILIVVWHLSFGIPSAHAMTTFFLDGPTAVRPGQDAVYAVRATMTAAINAVGITLDYDATAVTGLRFSANDSVVRQWLQQSGDASGAFRLEGIIPGGTAPVFTDTVPIGYFSVRFSRSGVTTLRLSGAESYLNQPTPAADATAVHGLTVTVSDRAPNASGTPPAGAEDVYALVTRESELLDGDWTLIFDIRTPQGAATHVLMRERFLGFWGQWHDVFSPVALSDQSRFSILELGIAEADGVRVVYRDIPARLVALAVFCGLLIIGMVVRFLMRR